MMKKRWLSLYVENHVGILAKISGLFAGKNYNLDSLTVGSTQDPTISRMTISLTSSKELFEQIKKQLNRCVGIIKVLDLTDHAILAKELLFVRIHMPDQYLETIITQIIGQPVTFFPCSGSQDLVLQLLTSPEQVDQIIAQLKAFPTLEVIRGGAVAMQTE